MTEHDTKRSAVVIVGGGRNAGRTMRAEIELLARIGDLEEYRAIGTVEEFKALKEKQIAKKYVWHKDMNGIGRMSCPTCLKIVPHDDYCCNCGQHLSWE